MISPSGATRLTRTSHHCESIYPKELYSLEMIDYKLGFEPTR